MDGQNQNVTTADKAAVVSLNPSQESVAMIQMIKEVALSPNSNVDAIRAMLDMQRLLVRDQAERAFNEALTRLSAKLPHVKKNGKIPLKDSAGKLREVSFAKWEDIDTVIRPLLAEEGFSLSFDTQPRTGDGGGLVIVGMLSHVQGHSRTASIPLPLDSGPGRNNLQAGGSTFSYGKKYTAFMLLNIVCEDEDDDGRGVDGVIDNARAVEIDLLITEVGADKTRFLTFMKANSVPEILASDYQKAVDMLKAKKKVRQAKA